MMTMKSMTIWKTQAMFQQASLTSAMECCLFQKDHPFDVLKLLLGTKFHFIDAYPELAKVYSILVAIPVTSATAERSFSALKRIKSRLRSTTAQDRLEGLLLMSLERKICLSLDKTMLIDSFVKTSSELCKALLG